MYTGAPPAIPLARAVGVTSFELGWLAGVAHAGRDPGDRGQQRLAGRVLSGAGPGQQLDLEVRERVDPRVAEREPLLQRGRVVEQRSSAGDLEEPADDEVVLAGERGAEALAQVRLDETEGARGGAQVGLVERHR